VASGWAAGEFVRRRKFVRWFRSARRTPSTSGEDA
jgi:hypothetical protein